MAKDFNCSAMYGCQHAFDNKVFKQDDSSSSSLEARVCACCLVVCLLELQKLRDCWKLNSPYFSQKKKKWNRHREMSLQISTKEDPRKLFRVSWPRDKKRLQKCKLVIQRAKTLIVFLCDCQCISELSPLRSSLLHFRHLPWLSSHNLVCSSPTSYSPMRAEVKTTWKGEEKKHILRCSEIQFADTHKCKHFLFSRLEPPMSLFLTAFLRGQGNHALYLVRRC